MATEKWLQFIEIGTVIVAVLASLLVGLRLHRNATQHEHAAQVLDEKVKQVIN
jgi:hypothetical protein